MGSVVTRLAAKKARKNGTRVIYTAHGFHFYTGAPLINWLLFYPVEWYLAKYTDTLITINHEDYNRAKKKFSKRCHDIQYVPGVGIDPKKFDFKMTKKEKHELRASLGLKDDDFVMIFPARLDKNKNQGFLIKCMPELIRENPKIHLLLPGQDELNGKYQNLAKKLGVEDNVRFLGKRDDVPRLLKISDLAVSSSKREGLPINMLEALESNLPIVALGCRGCNDILSNSINKNDKRMFRNSITQHVTRKKEPHQNINAYELGHVLKTISRIYNKKKTVLHLLSSNRFSGAENVACQIINGLKNEYNFIYCSPNGEIQKKLANDKIEYAPIERMNIGEIKKVLKKYSPDIIHSHDYKASIIASLAANNEMLISHIHQNHPKMRIKNIYSLIFLIVSHNVTKIIWVSEAARTDYAYAEKVTTKSITLNNIIDPKAIAKKSNQGTRQESYDIIYVGRLEYQKNPERFVKIASIITKTGKIKAAIVGSGSEYEIVKKEILANDASNRIKLLGQLDNPYPIIKKSKILIMTSRWEGLPMVALEALSLGTPIIATPTDGLKDIITNGENGYLANSDEEICSHILDALIPKNHDKLSHGARMAFSRFNNYTEYLHKIRAIYG